MQVKISTPAPDIIEFQIVKTDEPKSGATSVIGEHRCRFQLPKNAIFDDIHPDLLGLSALLMTFPYIENELELNFPVSKFLADQVSRHTPFSIGPVDEDIERRIPSPESVPGLAFSAGADSTAALALMPDSTVIVFLDRDELGAKKKKSMYRKDAALRACKMLRERGRTVFEIKSSLEYLRNPIGFPTDLAVGVPVILLADHVDIDSVAFGTVMESAYRVGHKKFQDYQERIHFIRWQSLFQVCGLSLSMVVAGVSEVGTQIIISKYKNRDVCRSCIRGTATTSCRNCWKCFRKELLEMAVEGKFNDKAIEKLFKVPEAHVHLKKDPIHHENILAWISSRYEGKNKLLLMMKKKTRGDVLKLDWLQKWYPPSLNLLPMKYRTGVRESISDYLETMVESEMKLMRDWDMEPYLSTELHGKNRDAMINALMGR